MALKLKSDQQVTVSIQPVDAAGNPALVDGVPVWTPSDPALLTVTVAASGLTATVVTVGPLGFAQVNVSVDADMGAGIRTISGTLDLEIVAAEAVGLTITAGTPGPKAPIG